MSSSSYVPQLPSNGSAQPLSITSSPDYPGLVKFLLLPFLESPNSLRVDCEISSTKPKVWIRLAFEGEDKGRVFGRGGRNIQAIRAVIAAAAKLAGQSVYLDIYGGTPAEHESSPPTRDRDRDMGRRPSPRPPSPSRAPHRLRPR
ncbi:KH domain-containing protein [Floridanema evergladense]|uniref:KH domain-containing protein n=1 Tax=Floridaenema evergladense BLCC-F167 TaxID=3153639 RepID=A0ABV4WPS0_9CYAN